MKKVVAKLTGGNAVISYRSATRLTFLGQLIVFLSILSFLIGFSWSVLSRPTFSVEEKPEMEPVPLHLIQKGIVPDVTEPRFVISFTDEEIDLLARMISAEARGEPFEGQLGVASVIVNRVLHPKFPDTIKEVIYQPGQFSPIANKSFYKVEVTEEHYRIAKLALEGKGNVGDSIFFFNPKKSRESNVRWIRNNSDYYCTIGEHEFRSPK